ncbi:MAG: SIS domain-containing protein, partial [Myxococcota bacterium]
MSDALDSLYPFLAGKKTDEKSLSEALLESVRQKTAESLEVKEAFFRENAEGLVKASRLVADSYAAGGRLFSMGNGGSSCDAAHIAVEFLHPITVGRPALPATHLGSDLALLTAVGNDVGFNHVFVRQLAALASDKDALIGVSTSGNSGNLMAAFTRAKDMGLATIGLTGGDGGEMKSSGMLDVCLVVETTSVHRIQESHVAAYHVLWDLV